MIHVNTPDSSTAVFIFGMPYIFIQISKLPTKQAPVNVPDFNFTENVFIQFTEFQSLEN